MKNSKFVILSCILCLSLIFNIILTVVVLSNPNKNKNIYGLYQATYYNNFDHQMILNVRLNKDGTCSYADLAAQYATEGKINCTFSQNGKKITLNINSGYSNAQTKEGQILDDGTLFLAGKKMTKID